MKTIRIYTKQMAEFLTESGFQIQKIVQDVSHQNFFNWIFEDTPEIRAAMSFYSEKKRPKTIAIYNSSMAYYFRKIGFNQIKMEDCLERPGSHIYIFEKTKELQEAMQNYSKSNSTTIGVIKDGKYTTSTTIKSQR